MKKLAIASASMALAAMPVVGVFAADPGSPNIVDEVKVVIDESCTFQATANSQAVTPSGTPAAINRHFSKDATLGATVTLGGDPTQSASGSTDTNPITIQGICNSDGSATSQTGKWTISALGGSNAEMVKTGGAAGAEGNIPTNLNTSGTASGWSMKIDSPTGTNGYNTWKVVPSGNAEEVASGNASGTAFTFQPSYRVYVGTAQASGTYTGTVTYTIASTWQSQEP